jgi:hypothetical protein
MLARCLLYDKVELVVRESRDSESPQQDHMLQIINAPLARAWVTLLKLDSSYISDALNSQYYHATPSTLLSSVLSDVPDGSEFLQYLGTGMKNWLYFQKRNVFCILV